MEAVAATRVRSKNAKPAMFLVDTDVHEMLKSPEELVPYLDPYWQRQVTEYSGSKRNMSPTPPVAYALFETARREWKLDDGTVGTDIDSLRRHLFDEEGISLAVLNGFYHVSARQGAYEFSAALAAAYNDWQIEHWLEEDPRLRGSVHVVAHNPDVAAKEIDRVAAHPQIVQVFLPTVTDREYGDPFYRPIFEAALRNDLVVTFHHGGYTKTLLGYPRYLIEWHTLAAPQAAMNQLLSLICNGLFDKYPALRVVFLEAGIGWVPWFMARLDQQYRELRADVPWVKKLPSDHMRANVRLSTQPMADLSPREFVELVERTRSEHMFMFSSDYPHYDADSAATTFAGVPDELRRRVSYENARETYPRLSSLAVE